MYNSIAELLAQANGAAKPLWRIVLEAEMQHTQASEETVFRRLQTRYDVMRRSAQKALDAPLSTVGGLIEGVSMAQNTYAQSPASICGPMLNQLMARALSCSEANASMGLICAAPTAGACGILPAVLTTVAERYALEERTVLEALLVASGIGAVITQNATVSGAEGGCQAECGVAAAMGAAAAVYMAGGSNEMQVHACSLALMNAMGLVCDPVAGLVQVPCAQRNASQAVNAVLSADLALAGMASIIPADQVVDSMYKVGRMLPPQLKETAMGGIAATPAAKAIEKSIFKK